MNRLISAIFRKKTPPSPDLEPQDPFLWCLVGNLKAPIDGGADESAGKSNNLYRAGQKLFCACSSRKGRFHRVRVVGRYKGGGRLIASYISTEKLETWRAKPIYSSKLSTKLQEQNVVWKSRDQVQELASWLNTADPKEFCVLPEIFQTGDLSIGN